MNYVDYGMALKFVEISSRSMIDASNINTFKIPFRIYRIQIKPSVGIKKILGEIGNDIFGSVAAAYDSGSIYFFAKSKDFEAMLEMLKKLDPNLIENLGTGFLEKIDNSCIFADFVICCDSKKAFKSTLEIDSTDLEWKGNPSFILEN